MIFNYTNEERRFMTRAVELAKKGQFSAMPNPCVGCVLVKNGDVIAEGWHERPGGPHAEAMALQKAGPNARGCTAYVTLEPCSFVGRTPACSSSLVAAGVERVVCAMQDPHSLVSGKGFAELRNAGIEVKFGLLEAEAEALNPGYIKRQKLKLPRVTLKMAMSLDGRTAMASGESQWITGAEARRDVQLLRAKCCCILTGINTVLHDNPTMNVRPEGLDVEGLELMAGRQPLRAILDSKAQVVASMNIVEASGNVLLFIEAGAVADMSMQNAETVQIVSQPSSPLDLRKVLEEIALHQCNEVLVEAGPTLAGAFVEQGLVDHLVIYVAPKLMGSGARPLLSLPIESMAENVQLEFLNVQAIGDDIRIDAVPHHRSST
ncbi:MAG: bifunctional diaminohydroxyphosphoribosylaminopyrimidine deaminase/5-amino-6-(5-phosphoribosylamino)uracil reductase RibD [Pseudomonadales bacterium]